ncbi:hypothetical protein [Agrococcus beijingensis]|uniref:hypothetical protein n=1 Tax=Agrococcus beijingensis TaxID=3068634 RepID=UPI00274185FA|nr:hypothetical protein [Agrococcus sp. REN33]
MSAAAAFDGAGGGGPFGAAGAFGGSAGGGGSFGGAAGTFGGPAGGGGSFGTAGGAFGWVPQPTAKASAPVAWDDSVTGIACSRLRDARWRANDAVVALASAPELRMGAVPGVAGGVLASLADELALRETEARALRGEIDRLHDDTELVGRAYELASDAVLQLVEGLVDGIAYGVGVGARALAIAALGAIAPSTPLLLAVGVSAALTVGLVIVPLAARIALAHPQQAAQVMALAHGAGIALEPLLERAAAFWERTSETLLANPAFVAALALAVESSDEALAGLLGIPKEAVVLLETEGGRDAVLAALAGGAVLGRAAGLAPPPVQVHSMRRMPPPEHAVSEPAEAMRVIGDGDADVTITTFEMPDGTRRHQVFVDGTQSPLPDPGVGLDGWANVENAASDAALLGSDAAVAEAMVAAGIEPDEPVDLFGYSQGAAAIANVAASGRFDVETALLVGGPVASVELPSHIAVLSVAHEGDPTAALDGIADGDGPTTLLLESAGGHGTGLAARHSRPEYIESLDVREGQHSGIDRHRDHLRAVTAGAVPVSTTVVELRRG